MSMLFNPPTPPAPPPPPPAAPTLASNSIALQAGAEKQRLAEAEGAGFLGTDVTGGKSPPPNTTKSLLGS